MKLNIGWAGCLLLAVACGCSFAPPQVEVGGMATLDGAAIKDGEIIFESKDQPPASGKIVNGKYQVKMQPGSKIIRINASERSGDVDPVMGEAPLISIIPEQYNSQSKLTAEITGPQEGLNFELKSKP